MLSIDYVLPARDCWARLRFAIIGGLLAAPPADGELQGALEELASRTWRHPFTGLDIRFGTSTIQRRYYAARGATDPVAVLRNHLRSDVGRFPSFSPEAEQALKTLYAQHPTWNAQLLHDNLRVILSETDISACPSYPSVRRYLKAQGLVRKSPAQRGYGHAWKSPEGLQKREIRSYEVEYVLQLLHLDFHHGSRKVCHAQWYTSESTEDLVHGLCQALQKVGLPR